MALKFGDGEAAEICSMLGDSSGKRVGRQGAAEGAEELRRRDEAECPVGRTAPHFDREPLDDLSGELVAQHVVHAIGALVGDTRHASAGGSTASVVRQEGVLARRHFLEMQRMRASGNIGGEESNAALIGDGDAPDGCNGLWRRDDHGNAPRLECEKTPFRTPLIEYTRDLNSVDQAFDPDRA